MKVIKYCNIRIYTDSYTTNSTYIINRTKDNAHKAISWQLSLVLNLGHYLVSPWPEPGPDSEQPSPLE